MKLRSIDFDATNKMNMMKKNIAMGLGGLAAIVIDYVVVASSVGLLLLARWIGVGWALDVLTVVLVSYVILAWLYGKRLIQYFSRKDDENPDSASIMDSSPITSVENTRSARSDSRATHLR